MISIYKMRMTILYTVIHFIPRRKETTSYHVQVQHGDPSSPHKALYLRFSFMLQFYFFCIFCL